MLMSRTKKTNTIQKGMTPTLKKVKKIEKREGSSCWFWTGETSSSTGHGRTSFVDASGRRRRKAAHRVSWELKNNKKFPRDLLGCHSCNNPECVNPQHIYPGDHFDNGLDLHKDNSRHQRIHPTAPLTRSQVKQIRRMHASGKTGREIAKKFGITETTVSKIVRRKTYIHVRRRRA